MTSASSFSILSDFLYFEGMCVWWIQVLKKSETLNVRFYDNICMPPHPKCMYTVCGQKKSEVDRNLDVISILLLNYIYCEWMSQCRKLC